MVTVTKNIDVDVEVDVSDVLSDATDEQIIAECKEREIEISDVALDVNDWVQRLRDAARTDILTAPGVPLEQISSLHKVVADFIAEATRQIL